MFCCTIRSLVALLLQLLLPSQSLAFITYQRKPRLLFSSRLFGWKEWSDRGSEDNINNKPREVLLLPFAATEALLPGQSREIALKQGRFLELFDECMEDHDSVLGMALMGEDNFLDTREGDSRCDAASSETSQIGGNDADETHHAGIMLDSGRRRERFGKSKCISR